MVTKQDGRIRRELRSGQSWQMATMVHEGWLNGREKENVRWTIKSDKKMKQVRKCKYCGKEFVARNGMQKYCCEECQTKAKEARKKRQLDFMNAVEPVIDLQCQEYLTFAKAAILMGCSRQYVYKLVNEGKLAASRISSRMAFIRKADIEKMLVGNPYHRVFEYWMDLSIGGFVWKLEVTDIQAVLLWCGFAWK